MFKRAIGCCVIALMIVAMSTPFTYAAEVATSPTEERSALLAKLDALVKLLTELPLQITQTATPLTAQSVPPQVLPNLPPPPTSFDGVAN